jgi:hypothetical protein
MLKSPKLVFLYPPVNIRTEYAASSIKGGSPPNSLKATPASKTGGISYCDAALLITDL